MYVDVILHDFSSSVKREGVLRSTAKDDVGGKGIQWCAGGGDVGGDFV